MSSPHIKNSSLMLVNPLNFDDDTLKQALLSANSDDFKSLLIQKAIDKWKISNDLSSLYFVVEVAQELMGQTLSKQKEVITCLKDFLQNETPSRTLSESQNAQQQTLYDLFKGKVDEEYIPTDDDIERVKANFNF